MKWVNNGERATVVLYFHLYSNLRPAQSAPTPGNGSSASDNEEPRLQITEVRAAVDNAPLTYALEDQGTSLRINLREPVAPGRATEILIGFKGSVPEVDPDETGLTSHVVKQVSAALRGDREVRRARDLNFRCRGVMLLGSSYPVLAVRDGDEWLRKLESSVGDTIFNEVADYEARIEVAPDVKVFTSAGEDESKSSHENTLFFSGPALRDFAIIAGRNLRSEQAQVGETTLRSIFIPEHERVGKRVLAMAQDSLKVFAERFGALPFKTLSIAEAPLGAGLGSGEFSGLEVIASAYYVDFDSPAMRNLPEIIREQRASVEESLEWSVAHLVAHAWWGAAVGNNPAREPVLDEAMASWSALLYFREVHGETKARAVLEDQLRGVYRDIPNVWRRRHGCESSVARLSQHLSIRGRRHHQRRADVGSTTAFAGRTKTDVGNQELLPCKFFGDCGSQRLARRAGSRSVYRTKANGDPDFRSLAGKQTW